jgi:hypothetical protein
MAKSTTSRIIGWVIKSLIGLFIGAMLGVMLWRILSSGDPKSMQALQPNQTLCDAYAAHT